MASSSISTRSPEKLSSSTTPQPLTIDNVRKHTKAIAVSSKKPKASRPVSPERTFPCQDKNYPRTQTKPLDPIQKAYANSGPDVHWCGDDRALFELDPAAKYNIRDYLLEQCKALTQTTNELTKPTGTKVVFVLRFNKDEEEQEALCVQTNAATLHGIYKFRNVHPSTKKAAVSHKMASRSAKSVTPRRLPRSHGTTSLARLTASANEEGFLLPDHELDSDSDEEQEGSTPLPHTTVLEAISEAVNEDEDTDNGFVDVVDLGAPKYCRDPGPANHPECHGRFKADSYAHNVVDAELDFRERFITTQSGRDSAAYYRNWRTLKHDHGETMVHGQSSLRNPVANHEQAGEEHDSGNELDDPTEQLLRLIDRKYGPLTLKGQKAKPDTKCFEECFVRVNEYLDRTDEDGPWLSAKSLNKINDDLVSEPSTLFEAVADLNDDDDVPAPPSTPTKPRSGNAPVMTEEGLEKLIDTPHEKFVNSYVQRYESMRITATRTKQLLNEARPSWNSIAASGSSAKPIHAPPELIVTAAAPTSSRVRDITFSADLPAEGHASAVVTTSCAPPVASEAVSEQIAPAQPCDVTTSIPAAELIEAVAPRMLPVMTGHEAVTADNSTRPASAQSMCSSRDGSSLPASVFSRRASVTTKPSNESFWSDSPHLIDALDLQIDVKSTPATVSHHERSVSMPFLTLSSPNTSETSVNVLVSNQIANAQATYVGPSTPTRAASTANKCLTPIIEVQTPVSSSSMPPTTMYASTVMDDPYEGFPTPNFHYPQPHVRMTPLATHESREEPLQPIPPSVFTDDSSFTDRRPRSNKFAASIKYRAHAVAFATQRATRRVVRSMKKMRATAQYFVPATFGSRNPFETVSRR